MGKVLVKYAFIFDAAEAWPNQNDFEQDLAAFFKECGFNAEQVEAAPGQEQIPTLYLTKDQDQLGKSSEVKFDPPKPDGEPKLNTR